MKINPPNIFVLTCVSGLLLACNPVPREVFIPITEPRVEILVGASETKVPVGKPVVLYAKRWNYGNWKLVDKNKLTENQCWMRNPPPDYEEEVAGNLRWKAFPATGARFNTSFRADLTREVVFEEPGTFTLEPSSTIWCVPHKEAKGAPIKIFVVPFTDIAPDEAKIKDNYKN